MQQQTDFQAQAAAAAATTLAAQQQAQQQAAATTLAVQQQMRELVNSAVTCLPVTSTFVGNVSNVVRDTPVLLSMVVPDSVMSLQPPCSSSTSLFKPSLTTAVPIVLDTNSSITLGSPKGHYANLGQGIRAKDQGHTCTARSEFGTKRNSI